MDNKNVQNPRSFIIFLTMNLVVMTIVLLDVDYSRLLCGRVAVQALVYILFGWVLCVSSIAFFYVPIKLLKTLCAIDLNGGSRKLQLTLFLTGVVNELLTITLYYWLFQISGR